MMTVTITRRLRRPLTFAPVSYTRHLARMRGG